MRIANAVPTALICSMLITCSALAESGSHKNPQRLGKLLIELIGITSPSTVPNPINPGTNSTPMNGKHFVVIRAKVKNAGSKAICARLRQTLKGEFGLEYRSFFIGRRDEPQISELLPGRETEDGVPTLVEG